MLELIASQPKPALREAMRRAVGRKERSATRKVEEVLGQCHGQHRHQEFIKFLRHLDKQCPEVEGETST